MAARSGDTGVKKKAWKARALGLEDEVADLAATFDRAWDVAAGLRGERDRARDVAVALEQQVAAVQDLHQPVGGRRDYPCISCGYGWPCATARALGVEP